MFFCFFVFGFFCLIGLVGWFVCLFVCFCFPLSVSLFSFVKEQVPFSFYCHSQKKQFPKEDWRFGFVGGLVGSGAS